jgi:hypothetical protein
VPQGEPFWVLVPLEPEFSAMPSVKLDVQLSTYLVPLRNPKIQSLDRRRLSFSIPAPLIAFSANVENDAKCVEVPATEGDWQDFWCAGGGLIPVPLSNEGVFDVSVRLTHTPTVAEGLTHVAFSEGEGRESSVVPLMDKERVVIVRDFNPQTSSGLRIASTRPARVFDPSGQKGFVVGFRRTRS